MASLHQLGQIHNSLSTAQFDSAIEYQSQANLNLYDSPQLDRLATQVLAGRYLRLVSLASNSTGTGALKVCLCEDNYFGWLALQDLDWIREATTTYCPIALSTAEIQARLPDVIAFAQAQMMRTNSYLWGGTTGPNYDCSGLVQRSFSSLGIWLPRDAYQQETFTQPVLSSSMSRTVLSHLEPGDLIFFGPQQKANHVGIHLGEGYYIHSSGENQGRNGIGIDQLTDQGNSISRTYYQQLRGAGRVVACYQPQVSV